MYRCHQVLHQVDSITKKLTSVVLKAQQNVPPGGKLSVLPSHVSTKTISLSRRVNLPELRRLQRQFVKWLSAHPPQDPSEVGISVSFLDYLETQI